MGFRLDKAEVAGSSPASPTGWRWPLTRQLYSSAMSITVPERLEGAALDAWRGYLQSHASILRMLDAELVAEHGMRTRDYEVLLYLAQAPDRKLPMSALAERTMLTRSGITRLVDGLVDAGWIERVACPRDARVSYARLTDSGYRKLRDAPSVTRDGVEIGHVWNPLQIF